MPYKFNPFTGNLDLVNTAVSGGGTDWSLEINSLSGAIDQNSTDIDWISGQITPHPDYTADIDFLSGAIDDNSTGIAALSAIHIDTKEPTGFNLESPTTIGDISFNDGSLEFTIAPQSGQPEFSFYINGTKFTKTSPDTVTIDNTEGVWFFYYTHDGTLTAAQTPWTFGSDRAFVAILYWDATNNKSALGEERHGIAMDHDTHEYLHNTTGATYQSGFTPTLTVDANGSLDAHAEMQSVAAGKFYDEDILLENAEQLTYEIWWKEGTNADWRWDTASAALVKNAVAGRPYYNELNGSTWQLTEMSNNDYILTHLFATNRNGTTNKIILVMGENVYATVGQARTGAQDEILNITTGSLPTPEFVEIASVIIQGRDTYSNTYKARVRSTDEGGDFVDFRTNDKIGVGAPVSDHGNLTGLSDDDHPQYLLRTDADVTNNYLSGVIDNNTSDITNNDLDIDFLSGAIDLNTSDITSISGTLNNKVDGKSNLSTQYAVTYVNTAGEITQSSSIKTDASGNLLTSIALIGTTTPYGTEKLGVNGSVYVNGAGTFAGNMTTTGAFKLGTSQYLYWDNSAIWSLVSDGSSYFRIYANNNIAMNANASGQVQINTTAPYGTEKLGVNGSVYVNGAGTFAGSISNTGGMVTTSVNDSSGVLYQVKTSASSALGYLGVEGSTAGAQVPGTLAYSTFISSGASGTALQFGSSGSINATLTSSGAFLINTTSAYGTEKLGVNGSMYVNGAGTFAGSITTAGAASDTYSHIFTGGSGVTKLYIGTFANTAYFTNNHKYSSGWTADNASFGVSKLELGTGNIILATAAAGAATATTALTLDSSQNATFAGDVLPDGSHSLGSASAPWQDLYVTSGSVHIGDVTLSQSGDSLTIGTYPFGEVLTSNLTVNLLTTDSTAEKQAKIDAVPTIATPGVACTFQFEDGTHTENDVLTFSNFTYLVNIFGNSGDNSLSNTKTVKIDTTGGHGIFIKYCKEVNILYLDIEVDDSYYCVYGQSVGGGVINFNYLHGASTTNSIGVHTLFCNMRVTSCRFSNLATGVLSNIASYLQIENCDSLATIPKIGITAGRSIILKNGTMPTGSVSAQTEGNGGQIFP